MQIKLSIDSGFLPKNVLFINRGEQADNQMSSAEILQKLSFPFYERMTLDVPHKNYTK